MNWLRDQANQPSTWRGFGILLSMAGVSQAEGIVQAVSAIVGGGIALYDIVRRGRRFGETRG